MCVASAGIAAQTDNVDCCNTDHAADILHYECSSNSTNTTNSLNQSQQLNTCATSSSCNNDMRWRCTMVGKLAMLPNGCYNRTIPATRRCNCSGIWEKKCCCETPEFTELFKKIDNSPYEVLKNLSNMRSYKDVTLKQRFFLLRRTAISTKSKPMDGFFKEFFYASQQLISVVQSDPDLEPDNRTSLGAQLLQTLDELALESIELENETIDNDVLDDSVVSVLSYDKMPKEDRIIALITEGNCITLPPEVLSADKVRVASFLFRNVSDLLPPRNTNNTIVSSIISSTTSCQECKKTELERNVTLMLQVEGAHEMDNGTLSCIFFEIENLDEDFPTGQWDNRGCTITAIGRNHVNCSCNHLTHFAILLSPGMEVSNKDTKALTILGTVLVPISLVCMLLVILTYSLIKSLWSMRNYIHIMLCGSLLVAQVLFMIGVDKTQNERVCSGIAVVLQYLFLVTFMWMLMEGVVLYVTLVTVFIKSQLHYIIGFTVACYVVPAAYMAIIVPIGFLVGVDDIPGHTHYLFYNEDQLQACWLNYHTFFIWSFIIPVIVILLTNVGFFIMALWIIRKHHKKDIARKGTDTISVKHWLKVSVSLTVIMGFTWLGGVLAFRKELLFIAYIMSILIAGQGVLIFIILVPLNKQVRDAYLKLWLRKKADSQIVTKLSRLISTSSIQSQDQVKDRSSAKTSTTSFASIKSDSNSNDLNGKQLSSLETCDQTGTAVTVINDSKQQEKSEAVAPTDALTHTNIHVENDEQSNTSEI